ncbi:MAG: hypothetical protein FJ096_05655 [Deltaproteobacteria bacterium]|nr:hypothetical protein [Deltaproteobacteria bacterium]
MRYKSPLLALFASTVVSVTADPMTAEAQVTAGAQEPAWLTDRQYREGAGILAGNFELHPGAAMDFGYDSNFMRRASDELPVGALQLRVSPSFSASTLGAQRRGDSSPSTVNFRVDTGLTYHEFIPIRGGTQQDRDVLRDNRNVDGFLRMNLDMLPGKTWSGRVFGGVSRSIRPTQQAITGSNFNRVMPGLGADLSYMPGSGLLDWHLGYEFSGTFFEKSEFSNLSSFRNEVSTRGRWRFLPRTAVLYDGRFSFLTYSKREFGKTSSSPVRTRVGMIGLITPSFGAQAMVGWGASFYKDDPQDFNSAIGQLELKWYLQPTMVNDPTRTNPLLPGVAVGFVRDFEDSLIGTYLERDQGYVRFNYLWGGSVLLNAEVAAGAIVFPNQDNPDRGQPNGWTDFRTDARVFAEYRIRDWIGVTAQADWVGYFSKTRLTFPTANGSDNLAFQQFSAFGGGRVFW